MLVWGMSSMWRRFAAVPAFLLAGFSGTEARGAACLRVMTGTSAQLVPNLRAPVPGQAPPESVSLTEGQLFPSPASPAVDPRFVQILIGRDVYRVARGEAKPIKLKSCLVQPICLVANTDSVALKNVDRPPEDGDNGTSFRAGRKFGAIALKMSAKNERFFLVPLDGDYYWVRGRDTAMNINKTCDEVGGASALAGDDPRGGKYAFGFEAGYGTGYKSEAYDGFITPVPDPSNVGPLSNPIITEVQKGKGLYIGPLLEMRFSDSFKLKFGAQYQENTYVYKGKENPTIAPNPLSALPDTEGTIKNQSLVFSAAPAWEFGGLNHRFGLGVNLRTHYYISKPASITYRVGTVFKANEVVTEAGPKGFETLALLNLYYQWYPGDNSPFALRLTAETDGGVMQLSLGAFY